MASLAQDSFCSPETCQPSKMLPPNLKCGFEGNSQVTCQNQQAHKAIIVQGGSTNHILIMVPMAKQLLNISRQVAVLRTMTLHCWMLKQDMVWIVQIKLAHEAYIKKQELALDTDRWKLDPIQCEIWEAMVIAMKHAVKESRRRT